MMTPYEVSSQLLARSPQPATVQSLIDLFRRDRELFFALSCVGTGADTESWAAELSQLATQLRAMIQRGYTISADLSTGKLHLRSGSDLLSLDGLEEREVVSFLRELNGTAKGEKAGKDYAGAEVSEAEVRFALGDPAGWEDDQKRLEQRMHAKPLVLRLDELDRQAVAGGVPAYTVHGLRRCATRLVQSASVMYRGLRRDGRLANGFAFCGRLPKAYDNDGKAIDPPNGMVYVVYADPDNYLFDWDWVKEDPHHPGHPLDSELRFTGDPEAVVPDAVLVDVEEIVPSHFNAQQAWPSHRGDCIFCYFSDEFAYADRINNDLTVFRSIANEEPTGFKIKNVERILKDGKKVGIVQVEAPDLKVKVKAQVILFAVFQRNPDMKYFRIYSVLIDSWLRRAADTEPPEVTWARPRETCPI
jgi:hypothetical protein